ncbi:unnamed protein product [Prorocentrum cordatum]|uniref:Uncharacterized protein n=1 Tax=Prorocentrum cordatum TaxID=2364126 RepID=A0ABN9QJK6_9DINO|nr:unnamed protein product [Polarella glacialis]
MNTWPSLGARSGPRCCAMCSRAAGLTSRGCPCPGGAARARSSSSARRFRDGTVVLKKAFASFAAHARQPPGAHEWMKWENALRRVVMDHGHGISFARGQEQWMSTTASFSERLASAM